MTEIVRAGTTKITTPAQILVPADGEKTRAGQPEGPRTDRVQISGQAPAVDSERHYQRMAQELAYRTSRGIEDSRSSLSRVADLWRQGQASPENLRGPASQILEAAGTVYKGIQPLMSEQSLQVGPYRLKGFELVGGLVPMDALLPNENAPAAINKAWANLEGAAAEATAQLEGVDRSIAESIPQTEPGPVNPRAGVHNLPPQSRILELLS